MIIYFKLNATFDFDLSAQELIQKAWQITQVFLNFTLVTLSKEKVFLWQCFYMLIFNQTRGQETPIKDQIRWNM